MFAFGGCAIRANGGGRCLVSSAISAINLFELAGCVKNFRLTKLKPIKLNKVLRSFDNLDVANKPPFVCLFVFVVSPTRGRQRMAATGGVGSDSRRQYEDVDSSG